MNEGVNQDRDKDRALSTADIARGERAGTVAPPPRPTAPAMPSSPGSTAVPPPRDSAAQAEQRPGPLFAGDEALELRSRWNSIQVGFVDEPRKCVQEADALVATTVKRVAEIFADERSRLEAQWDRGDRLSTEDLRVALQRYRSFFTRLLSV